MIDGIHEDSLPDPISDAELDAILKGLEEGGEENTVIKSLADLIHNLAVEAKKGSLQVGSSDNPLSVLGFKQFRPPSQLVRHPPPAVGHDDDIHKLAEILDDVMKKCDHTPEKGEYILTAPDHKIGKNVVELKKKEKEKYRSLAIEFALLHLRKSKITNACSAYKDIGMLHLLMYMRDTKDTEWATLIQTSHIDQATKFIRRLSLGLHVAFMITFLVTCLSDEQSTELLDALGNGSIHECSSTYEEMYKSFIQEGISKNVIFAAHHEMMVHCDHIVALAFSERLGGKDGHNLLLAVVKESLPFAFLNNSSSYGLYACQLLNEYYKSGVYVQELMAALFTSRHKNSDVNFGLDTQRELEHQDITRSFRSGGTVTSVVPKMASVDFLVNELQDMVRNQNVNEKELVPKKTRESEEDRLSFGLSLVDLA